MEPEINLELFTKTFDDLPIGVGIFYVKDLSDIKSIQYTYMNKVILLEMRKSKEEVFGNRIIEVAPEAYESEAGLYVIETYRKVATDHKSVNLGLVNYSNHLVAGIYDCSVHHIIDNYVYVMLNNVTELEQTKCTLEEKNKLLEKNFQTIQTLFKETHHRVKNNMQIISSLLNLQSDKVQDSTAKRIFEECKSRIYSMALVHQKLYSKEDLTNINIEPYVKDLIQNIDNVYSDQKSVKKIIDIDIDLIISMNAMIPLGLILNELITNSYKHAFHFTEDKWIKISFKKNLDKVELTYLDSGPGIPQGINHKANNSLGLEIVRMLSEQLEGDMQFDNLHPSTFIIRFNDNFEEYSAI